MKYYLSKFSLLKLTSLNMFSLHLFHIFSVFANDKFIVYNFWQTNYVLPCTIYITVIEFNEYKTTSFGGAIEILGGGA